MTDDSDEGDEISAFSPIAEEFGLETDRLAKYDDTFKKADLEPISIYQEEVIGDQDAIEDVIQERQRVLDNWREHMAQYDRHPVCPSIPQAAAYVDALIERDIKKSWVKRQLDPVEKMFDYFDFRPDLPHELGPDNEYNPITQAREYKSHAIANVEEAENKRQHDISVEKLGRIIRQIKNVLHRCVITTQLKYGARPGQVAHLKIPELRINHSGLKDLYPNLGTHERIQNHDTDDDVIYFVSRSERSGVKSNRPVLLPVDRELRNCLITYLRIRPPVDNNWLFLRNTNAAQLSTNHITKQMWKPVFHPEYSETDQFEAVTAHYARHRFTTFWKKEKNIQRNLLRYMRGDKKTDKNVNDSIDTYVHSYYHDIRDLYLSHIYKFGL